MIFEPVILTGKYTSNNNNHIFGRNGTYVQNIYIKFIFTALSYQAIKLLQNNLI